MLGDGRRKHGPAISYNRVFFHTVSVGSGVNSLDRPEQQTKELLCLDGKNRNLKRLPAPFILHPPPYSCLQLGMLSLESKGSLWPGRVTTCQAVFHGGQEGCHGGQGKAN